MSEQIRDIGEGILHDFTNGNGTTGRMESGYAQVSMSRRQGRTFTTSKGVTWPLQGIPAMLIRQIYADEKGKPEVPIVEVKYGKKVSRERNELDPGYKAALAEWETLHSARILTYIITRGVGVSPSGADIARLREFFPGSTDSELKYAWVLESMESDEEAGALMNAILGITTPTAQGVRDAEAIFPGNDQSESDRSVSNEKDTSADQLHD